MRTLMLLLLVVPLLSGCLALLPIVAAGAAAVDAACGRCLPSGK